MPSKYLSKTPTGSVLTVASPETGRSVQINGWYPHPTQQIDSESIKFLSNMYFGVFPAKITHLIIMKAEMNEWPKDMPPGTPVSHTKVAYNSATETDDLQTEMNHNDDEPFILDHPPEIDMSKLEVKIH